jgi:signal transduction histidine kinase
MKKMLSEENISYETRKKIEGLIREAIDSLNDVIEETEQPLFVAASIGLTYMVPTHEARRNIQESMKILKFLGQKEMFADLQELKDLRKLLRDTDDIIGGIVRISQKVRDEETFNIVGPVETALDLMRYKLKRNNVSFSKDCRTPVYVHGSDRMIAIALLNMIDNSIYWLGSRGNGRELKVICGEIGKKCAIIVSDNGPGLQDDIDVLTLPFFTRKPKGMGLGLYICNRIAEMHKGKLKIFDQAELPGLLGGANIGMILPRSEKGVDNQD